MQPLIQCERYRSSQATDRLELWCYVKPAGSGPWTPSAGGMPGHLDFSRRSAARLLRETELDAKDQPVESGLITRLLIRGEHVG